MSNNLIGARSVFTKTVSALTSVATLLTLSGAAYLAPLAAQAAVPSDYGLTEGNMISASGSSDPDVYIVNAYGYKRLFLNPAIFAMYAHLGGFANVKSVSAAARDAFPTTQLFRNCESNDQAVYAVEVSGEDTATLHHVVMTGDAAVAQDANFFKKVFCVNNREATWYTMGSDYTSLSQIPPYVRTPGATPTPTGAVSASLASDNPASGTLVKSQAAADLAHFMFTGSGTVTSISLQRLGVSADTDLTNVYLYDGIKRLTDAATVTNGMISFNDSSSTGLFAVNGSRNISVRADLSSSTGQTVGVALKSVNGSSVNISGNLFNVANADLATVSLSTSVTPSTNAALDPASDVVIWQDTATVGTRFVSMKALQLRVIGSVYTTDLQNYRLYVDGLMVGSAVSQSDANGYVVFDLSNAPVKLETGGRVLKVMADVLNGSSRNFTASLRQAPDFFTVDSQYLQPVKATGTFPVSAGQQTISSGTLTITKLNTSASGDVVKGASGVALAKFELKANGERMKIETLRASFTSSNGGTTTASNVGQLRNGALFLDGVQVGSTQSLNEDSWTTTYTEFSLGSSAIVNPGQPRILEIRSDIYDADGTDNTTANDTIIANIVAQTSNVQRLTSLGYTDVTAKTGNTLTVRTGSLSGAKYTGFANQSVTSPATGVKVGHFTLTQSSSEDVNMNTINIDGDSVTGTFLISDLTDAYIKVWNDAGSVIYTSPAKATLSATASNSYSVNFTLPKTKTYQVEVWANVPSGETATHALSLDMDAAGITTGSSTSVTSSAVVGQTITVQTGALTVSNGSIATAALRAGGSTVDNAYQFTITPAYDDFTLDEVYVDLSSTLASSTGAVATLRLFEGATEVGSATVNGSTGSASFTGLNRTLTQAAGVKTYTVKVSLASVGNGANDTYGTVIVRLDGLKYRTSAGAITTTNGLSASTYTGNDNRVVASYPVFSNVNLDSTLLAAGDKTIFRTAITAANTVKFKKMAFTVTTAAGPVFGATSTIKLLEDGNDITSAGAFATASYNFQSGTGGTGTMAFTFTNERSVGGHTYELVVNIASGVGTGDSIVAKIANPSTTASAPDDATTMAATSASLVWTDSSSVSHSTSTDDWFNDYLVKTLNSSQSLNAQF
ncbi:MAG: hypothetical protein KBC81_03180 [Candidatus Pacebacteria bacterium]|nr:hypothetical protein [Candidatus Paceibacterota bacterium]